MSHLLTIFKASEDDQGGVDLDVAILKALLKGKVTTMPCKRLLF